MSAAGSAGAAAAPGFSRLLLVATGSVSAAHLPFWGNWLRLNHPETETRVVVTPSAERFVTRSALAQVMSCPVVTDRWPDDPEAHARHVELAQWPDVVLVHPMTLDFMARLALGRGDSPVLLALQCTSAAVVLTPALPPGGARSPAYTAHLGALSERPNVTVLPPRPGLSTATGRRDAWAPAPLPEALEAAAVLHAELRAANADDHDARPVAEAPGGTPRPRVARQHTHTGSETR